MEMDDKPIGAQLGWRRLDTEYPFESPWFRLRQDRLHVRDGEEIEYAYLEEPPGVLVVPLTADGQVVLVEQYRYTIDAWCLQVPAGGTHDAAGHSLEEVARKELEEELGASCGALQHLGAFYPSLARTNGKSHVYLARDVVLRHRPEPETGEAIRVRTLPAREALALARAGRLADGQAWAGRVSSAAGAGHGRRLPDGAYRGQ